MEEEEEERGRESNGIKEEEEEEGTQNQMNKPPPQILKIKTHNRKTQTEKTTEAPSDPVLSLLCCGKLS